MELPFKKKEKPEPIPGIYCEAKDYRFYTLSALERILCYVVGAAAGFAVGWIFYESLILSIILGAIVAFAAPKLYQTRVLERRRTKLQIQFRDMLESLSTSIGAGNNITDAFLDAADDMRMQYGEKAAIVEELQIINVGVANNINIEDLLMNFGQRSENDDIMGFANVFDTCYRKGGNINQVLKNTRNILNDKMGIALEIKTMVSSKTTEQNMMLVMPVVFVLMLKSMGADMVDLTSRTGRLSTTIAIVLFAAAYFVGKKILSIKV